MGKQHHSRSNQPEVAAGDTRQATKRRPGIKLGLGRLIFFATGIFLLFILFRLFKIDIVESSPSVARVPVRGPTTIEQPAAVAAKLQKATPRFVPRELPPSAKRGARVTEPFAAVTPEQKSRSRSGWGERLLLFAEISAVLLVVGAGVAFWNTLTDVNNTYRALQRVDVRTLPTVIPAANPGMAFEAVAQRAAAEQAVAMLPPFNSVPAPPLPTPYPTSTPVATLVPQPTRVPNWGMTAALQKQAPDLEYETSRRIHIPSIGVDSYVYQNYGQDWLKLGVVQFGDFVAPGEPGNLVLAAHNDIYGEIFRDLDRLQAGDAIVIDGDRSTFNYRVRETLIVEPTETWVMLPTSKPTLTLISCYPYLLGTQRIVVFADIVQ